ncbi:MAG: hypothetical protein GX489_04215 [Firmicutes bacterium]|mgnify:CR=1 FL=1|nr:hypothetical protein [Bacillota bacterium]
MIFLLILLYLAIIAFETPKLVKEKKWRDLLVFSLFMLAAIGLSLPVAMGVNIPNPSRYITRFFAPLSKAIMGREPFFM